MLPAENRQARLTSSQSIPQSDLRRRHLAPKILRDADCSRWRPHVPDLMRPLHRAPRGPPPPLSRGRMQFNASLPAVYIYSGSNYAVRHEGKQSCPVKQKRWRNSRPRCVMTTFRSRRSPSPRPASSTPSAWCCSARPCRGARSSTITCIMSATARAPCSAQASARPARRARRSPTARSRMRSSSTIFASPRPACIPAPPCSPARSPRPKKPRSAARI